MHFLQLSVFIIHGQFVPWKNELPFPIPVAFPMPLGGIRETPCLSEPGGIIYLI